MQLDKKEKLCGFILKKFQVMRKIKSSGTSFIHQEGDSQDSKHNTKSFNNRRFIIVCECLGFNYVKLFLFDKKEFIV